MIFSVVNSTKPHHRKIENLFHGKDVSHERQDVCESMACACTNYVWLLECCTFRSHTRRYRLVACSERPLSISETLSGVDRCLYGIPLISWLSNWWRMLSPSALPIMLAERDPKLIGQTNVLVSMPWSSTPFLNVEFGLEVKTFFLSFAQVLIASAC